jgi:type I restriction enzyme M protein
MNDNFDRSDFKRLANAMSRAFRDSDGGGIVERFESVSKLLFVKMVDDRMVLGTWQGSGASSPSVLNWRPRDTPRSLYERARRLWLTATGGSSALVLQGEQGAFPTDVEAVAKSLRLLQPYNLDALGVDIKGAAYEELLRDTFEKNDNQQYFTPRHLMDFVVEMVDPSPSSVICDPAAGSGGFLVGALNYVANNHPGEAPRVAGVDVDERMAWVARINVFLHGGDPAAIGHLGGAGSLRPWKEIERFLPKHGFSAILTNPPFGSDMTNERALSQFETGKGRATRRRGVLFIERCLDLLEPGGLLAVVIDDSILNLGGNSDIRSIIRRQATVEAVISLPDVTFMPYSTAKSSVVLMRKKIAGQDATSTVFMADVEYVGNRPNGDPLYKETVTVEGTRVLWSDLPEVTEAFRYYCVNGELPPELDDNQNIFVADVDSYLGEVGGDRLDVNFFHPTRSQAANTLDVSPVPALRLDELFQFDNSVLNAAEMYPDAQVNWIGLGDVVAETGEYAVAHIPADRIKSAVHSYRGGDILMSKLRPKLRKIVFIPHGDEGGLCSAELVVLRPLSTPAAPFLPDYVSYILRSDLGFGQQVHQITGVGRPRVGVPALRGLRIPIPPLDTQRELLDELDAAFAEYQRLHAQAQSLREQAHQRLSKAYETSVTAVTVSPTLEA